MAKVFISYSHDSDAHKDRVRALADQLRLQNVDVVIDQLMGPGGPAIGWSHWSEIQVMEASYVLVACTATYCRRYEGDELPGIGYGASWEARAIYRQLYDSKGVNEKFRVVLFDEADKAHIPGTLKDYQLFLLPQAYGQMVAWLAGPAVLQSPAPEIKWPAQPAYIWDMANCKDVTERFEKVLTGQSAKRILLLSAESNSGKTHLLVELRTYAQRLGLSNSLLDCKGSIALDELFQSMFLDLPQLFQSARIASASARSYSVIQDLKQLQAPVLFMFDTYEKASDDSRKWIEMQLLSRLPPAVVVVVAGQSVPELIKQSWKDFAEHLPLQPIQRASDWYEYGQRKWQGSRLTLDRVEALTLATKGNPGLLAALLGNLITGLQAKVGAQGAP